WLVIIIMLIALVLYATSLLLISLGTLWGLIRGVFKLINELKGNKIIIFPTFPNQGIWNSIINAMTTACISGLFAGVTFGTFILILNLLKFNSDTVAVVLTYGILGAMLGGVISGIACIQHFTLRLILYCNGYIPWNYARFLDYCTERLFLQRVGGRYRFIHKLLQDHFAQMDFKRN
ncbi:MAG: NACHT domain-containing protein, partial [Nostoc sp.]